MNGWLGEVQGLQISLDAAITKLTSINKIPADGKPVLIGMPVIGAGPSSTRI